MKEIGGYIELDENRGAEYHGEAVAVNSGRHALEYLIRAKGIKKLYIPYFLCSTIRETCEKCGCGYEYYHISQDMRPVFSRKLNEKEYLYIVNYYGQITDKEIRQYKEQYHNIIFDNAQDFFRKPIPGVDTIYTCRKFFGVSDGGYVYTDAALDEDMPADMSYDRIHYILGRYEAGANAFYREASDNNEFFASEPLKRMSKLTHNILRGIDYDFVRQRRTENYRILHEYLGKENRLELRTVDGAFAYPLLIENGAAIRKVLQNKKIYIPTLWPEVLEDMPGDSPEYRYASDILPLPCDQRYNTDDMEYIIKEVTGCMKN